MSKIPRTVIELSYLIYPLSLCTHLLINLTDIIEADIIIDLLVSIPKRIKISLDIKVEHKILYDVFARIQDYDISFEEVSLYCHPYKLKEFKYFPLKKV